MSYAEGGYYHQEKLCVMSPANILVIVADTKDNNESNLPTSWADLLKPMWQRKIALRGDKDFFCNAVFFPFVKTYGLESLKRLAHNTAIGLHPSQMVKMINSNHTDDISIYVMPFTFYRNVRDKDRFRLIWPTEGGIISPVQMLVKKGGYEKHQKIIDFIMGEEMISIMLQIGFPLQTTILRFQRFVWVYIYTQDLRT